MDSDLIPIRSGSVFTDGLMPGAVPVNFVTAGAPFSDGAHGGMVPPASEMSVMRTQMVTQQPPSAMFRRDPRNRMLGDFATDAGSVIDAFGRNADRFIQATQARPFQTQSNVTVGNSVVTTAVIVGASIIAGLWLFGRARR